MFLTDFHTHSSCSPDASSSMLQMALAGAEKGISVMCITDHVDIDDFMTGNARSDCFGNWEEMRRQFGEAKEALKDLIDLRLGIEFGEANHASASHIEAVTSKKLDFIIGSIHNLRGYPDFFCIDYKSASQCENLVEKYVEEHFELVRLDCFDVIGHLGYTRRYMKRAGYDIGLGGHTERIKELFRLIRDGGKGIELNTSGLRDGTGSAFPELGVLKLYRELGGEIVTTGSDSHRPEDVGKNLEDGMELLREAGFRYFTVFKERKPEFIKL